MFFIKKRVTIYTFETCPFCVRAKKLLDSEGIAYKEVEISNERNKLSELESMTGSGTVPQIFVDEQFIGGNDDLQKLYQNNEKFNQVFK